MMIVDLPFLCRDKDFCAWETKPVSGLIIVKTLP